MKIIYIFRSFAIIGGVEKILINKMNYLSEKLGYDITVITYEQGLHPIAFPLSPKVKHIDLGIPFHTRYKYGLLKRFFIYIKMKHRFKKEIAHHVKLIKPDITICTTYSFLDINAIIHLQDTSKKIIESHSAKMAIGKRSIQRRNLIFKLASSIADRQLYRYIKRCDALVTLTQDDAKEWGAIKKAVIIPNMIANYPSEIKTLNNQKKVISVGRLTEQKGYDMLIKVWELVNKIHPEWILEIYGEGEMKEALLQEIKEKQLDSVITIHKPTKHIYEKYMESSIYVLSSRWEGFALVLLEAMSCAIPCIAFNCPYGASDIIEDGKDGIIVENGNIKQLAEKINFLIENEELRKQMGKRARENVKKFLPNNVMSQWSELFLELLKNKPNN
ncbi:glycosyltransferase family 4 protein [Bacteroides ihuae]|uniref:glycosyltransferase family 4 protein n=1 Tax=Bacteroides ihuae TaxID=1852362 RepID=UPI0008DB1753|nr:glycosyltransferase family 4 protein [Bacteroides ihuae]